MQLTFYFINFSRFRRSLVKQKSEREKKVWLACWPLLSFMCRIYWTFFVCIQLTHAICLHAIFNVHIHTCESSFINVQYWFNIYALWEKKWVSERERIVTTQYPYTVHIRCYDPTHSYPTSLTHILKNNWCERTEEGNKIKFKWKIIFHSQQHAVSAAEEGRNEFLPIRT